WWDGNTTTPRTITLTKDTTISATFAVISNFTVTITPPTNGSITVMDGTTPVNNGDVVEDGTTLTLTATPAEGYKFSQWWDGNTTTPRTITVTKDTIISATFTAIPNFTAIIPTVSNGTITVMNGSTPVTSGTQLPEGTILSLTATPDLDYMLDRWWDGNTNATRNITLTGDTTISATFRKISTVMFFDGTNLRKSTWSSSTLTTAASEVLAAPPTGGTYKAIEFANGVVYAVHRVNNFPATTSFGTLDKTTGTYTIINTDVGYDVTGLAWNPQDNTMYAAYGTGNNRGFAKIDLKTGALTEIGPQIFGMNIWWTIAIDNEGDCYAMEYGGTSRIGKINLETGAFTQIVGNLSSASMFTDMSIDRETNQIYANTPGGNTVFTIASINKTTGARTTFGTVTTRWHAFAVFVDEPAPMHTVTITSETHGNITVMNGATVVNTGDQLPGGTVLTLTATPNANAEFVAWWDGDTATTRTIALIANTTISATFVARYHTVTFATPSNGTLSVTYRNEVNEVVSVESGEEVEEGTILTITATPNDHYYLELLEVNNSPFTSSQTYTVMNDVTINVAFAINQYQVTYATPAGGTLTVTRDAGIDVPSGTSVDHGTVLTITATPNPNHTLATLTVNSATFTNGSTHTVNGPVTITASFQITYTLTITQPDGENVIEVWDVDEMVQFGSGSSIEAGTELKLMAFPADDYEFVEWWDGNTEQFRTITLDSDMTISATFQEVIIYYTVFIEAPEIGGTITVMKNEKGVVSDGDELEAGTELILLATAHQGYRFVEWWHGGTDAEHTHVLNDHVTISAIFEDDEVSIAITIGRELFAVYPNPTADVLHIQTEQVIKQIFVLDLTGKVMMTLQGDQKTINLQSLPIGHYIVRIHTDTTIVPVKIVKQ
ncbi:MAG: T9SS type A sorting domain-containing protein, partial [Bacteroidales bacterium]|nr:T9SS type A sorting domain-containing protein [Bacteroidales bacterium]